MIEKILERLEEARNDMLCMDDEDYFLGKSNAFADAKRIVQEVAKDGGWIPCSERLPEENGLEHYEITFLSGIKKVPFRGVAIFSKGRWYMAGTNCRDCDRFPFEVIAWKEPSAPYQKGE